MTICGVLLLNKNNELIVWTRSGGIYSIAEQCRGAIDRKRVGEWIDFEIENGFVESLTSRDRTVSGGRATRLRGDKVQFLGSIKIPTEEESNKIGWTEPAVHCTFLGKVCTSYQFIWTLRSYDLSLGHECWVDWDPKTERFNLAAQTVVEAKHTKFFEKAYIPWDLENTTELGWKSGILMARTNFSSFVATEYGDFILTAHSERIGDKPPVIGCYLKCKLRSHKAKLSDQNVGEVLAYEVLPMPDDCEVHSLPLNGAFCVLRCRAKVLRFQETRDKRAILFNSTLYACHDTESLIRNPKIGVYYDVIVRRPKDEELIQCDQGWKIVKVMGELEGYEERQNLRAQDFDREEEMGRRKATSQFKRQEAKNDDDSLTHELRGIVMNQTKGYNFISFSNDKEAAYHRKGTRSKGFQELELGGHVYCLVRDMQTCSENDTPRCEILSYQTIPSPAGWGVAGTTDAGLARIICPLRFLHMSQGRSRRPYPIYHNELMEKVHDYDRRTIGFSEKLDVELLKRLKVKAEVIRTRVPEWRGRNGLLLKVLLEKEIVDLDDDWLQQGRIVEELESERNSVPNESNDRFPTKSQKQELRGIVMNQAKGMNFIFLSNGMEASYSMLDATRNNAPMKLGDHLECVISDVLTFDDVKKRTKCEILSYRIVPTPTGWGFEGQTPAGLAKVEEPDVPIRRREEPKSTPIQKKEPCREYQTKGFVIKRWGLFLIVCLENKRSAIIDTRNFPDGVPELGTFIECDVKMLNASILDQEMIYEWEVVNMGPIDRSDYESIVEKDTAYVFSRHLMFEGYLSVGKTRQAHFSHPFFGSICDKYDIIYSSSQPGDPIEAYIGAVRDGESKFQWIITDPKANVNSPQKPLPRAVIPHFAEEYESENNLPTTSETYSVHDAQSKISYGTSDETKRINSRVTDRSTSKPVDQGRALTCEDLVTKAMNNPEIRDVIFRADPD